MKNFDALSKEELKHLLKLALSSNQELKSDIDSLNDKVSELKRIIELPITPFCIVCHKIMARHCRVCNRRVVASPDFSDRVVGKGRLGVRLLSQCQQMLYEKPPLASVQRKLVLINTELLPNNSCRGVYRQEMELYSQ